MQPLPDSDQAMGLWQDFIAEQSQKLHKNGKN